MKLKKFYRCLYKKCNYEDYIHIHYDEITIFNEIIKQETSAKPFGFWVSYPNIYNSWTGFCTRGLEERIDPNFNTIYRVEIVESKILYIDTIKELEGFHKKYSNSVSTFLLNYRIKWNLLEHQWSGIFIQDMYPYLDKYNSIHQEILSWYRLWDCVSGCIWNGNAVNNVEILYKKI